ncbi:MAG: tRNA modification GTPase TrmE [Xanthobacteraceae bacterium]|nr:tRNA modification GTPase TrmE [Xanthobacteraceae bacterium]
MGDARDTIFALSSGRPPAAIAVVRISGPQAGPALRSVIGRVPEPRRAALARIKDPATGDIIDEALALWFPGPNSETGEDTVELQLHGGHAVVAGVLRVLGQLDGLRMAEPGEFTRRAFESGRLDLTAVEGLADLIGAETEAQRQQAFRQMKGLLGHRAETWRGRLIQALALVEARIDFSDEADVPEDLIGPAMRIAGELRDEIAAALVGSGRSERLRDGLTVAIAGPPNAGKSTLINRLAKRDVAIVSPIAGTTRDVIEVHLDLGGYPVTLLDTAGIRESQDIIEQEGVRRARARAAGADLILWLTSDVPVDRDDYGDKSVWTVRNKIDVAGDPQSTADFAISATVGTGMDALVAALGAFAKRYFASGEAGIVTRERHRRGLEDTVDALTRALAEGASGREDIVAEELRRGALALGRLTGRVDVEDILDVIFRDFCIGK